MVPAVEPAALQSLPSDVQLLNSDPVILVSYPVLVQWQVLMLGLTAAQCQGQFPHEFAVAAVGHFAGSQYDALVVALFEVVVVSLVAALLVVMPVMSVEAAVALLAVALISVTAGLLVELFAELVVLLAEVVA